MKKTLFAALLLFAHVGFAQNNCAHVKVTAASQDFILTVADIELMNQYDLNYYKFNLDVQNNSKYIQGSVYLEAKTLSTMHAFTLQLHNALTVDSVWFNQKKSDAIHDKNFLYIEADADSLLANTPFNATIFYHGTTPTNSNGAIGGAGFSTNISQKVTWTLSQPFSAYEWFPCKQLNTDKIDSMDMWINTDTINKVGSNGLLKNIVPLGNGKHSYQWFSKYPIAYYLISIAVSPYQEKNSYANPVGHAPILVQNYMYKNATAQEIEAVDHTPALIEVFSEKFGMYPFANEKYGHSQAPIPGAMEHQTMTSIGAFNFEIVAHELGHQYFGDYVTCNAYSEIWLNEGFATFTEYVALENLFPGKEKEWLISEMNRAKQANGTVFVNDSFDVGTLFDGNSSYAKGGMVVHMLRNLINNDSIFFLGLRNYLAAYAFGSARTPNFKEIMEQTSGLNLDQFFTQWIYNEGYPILSGKYNQVGGNLWLSINQEPSSGSTVFKFPLEVRLKRSTGDTSIYVQVDAASKMLNIPVGMGSIQSIRFDPNLKLLRDVFSIAKDPNFTSLSDLHKEFAHVMLYPNPANNELHVKQAAGSQVQIFDMRGQLVQENALIENDQVIDIASLLHGVYVVQFKKNESTATLRFVKH
jgi:aminopeptidase N